MTASSRLLPFKSPAAEVPRAGTALSRSCSSVLCWHLACGCWPLSEEAGEVGFDAPKGGGRAVLPATAAAAAAAACLVGCASCAIMLALLASSPSLIVYEYLVQDVSSLMACRRQR